MTMAGMEEMTAEAEAAHRLARPDQAEAVVDKA
jgi:hypothetical protein